MYRAVRMTDRLPLLAPFQKQHSYCTYCPKLCRFSCPVSVAQASETTTPWAKMASAHHANEGNLSPSATVASSWYGCSGCLRCRSHCAHRNEVASTLHAARAEAVGLDVAPRAALRVIEEHPARAKAAAEAGAALFRGEIESDSGRIGYFPGCTANRVRPEDAVSGHTATRVLAREPVRALTEHCCGLPLLDAGDPDGFRRAAASTLEALAAFEWVVFLDPGCLHALKVEARRHGLDAPTDRLMHLSEFAARHIDRVKPLPSPTHARYHDPCRLGRGLGVYEAPRRVLTKLLGNPVDEFHHQRTDSICAGAGGQLPRTDPGTANAIAEDRIAQHDWVGGGTLVTSCPASARQFERAGSVSVRSLASLLAEGLGD